MWPGGVGVVLFHLEHTCPSRSIVRGKRGFEATRSWGLIPPFTPLEVLEVIAFSKVDKELICATVRLRAVELPDGTTMSRPGALPLPGVRLSAKAIALYDRGMSLFSQLKTSEAIDAFEEAGMEGHIDAMFTAGHLCSCARPERSALLTRLAAEQGHRGAMVATGLLYQEGIGVARDDQTAMQWYLRAASSGCPAAMCRLGEAFRGGVGTPPNSLRALTWFLKAALLGYPSAMDRIACIYSTDHFDGVDREQAYEWWRMGAMSGDATSMFRLGKCLDRGQGVPKDGPQALVWWRKAAALGVADAMLMLCLTYRDGRGVPVDRGEAEWWLRKAMACVKGL